MRLLLLTILALPAAASSTVPNPWQQNVLQASFVGVIQCTRAGAHVADFVVRDSWKGPADGSKLRMELPADWYESNLRLALIGERYLVVAYPPRTWTSHDPLSWRPLKPAHTIGDWLRLPLARMDDLGEFDGAERFGTVAKFRAAVQAWLKQTPEHQRCTLLRFWTRRECFSEYEGPEADDPPKHIAALLKRWKTLRKSKAICEALLGLIAAAPDDDGSYHVIVRIMLSAQIPRADVRARIKAWHAALPAATRQTLADASFQSYVDDLLSAPKKAAAPPAAPTRKQLAALRAMLAKERRERHPSYDRFFGTLAVHDPKSLADWLMVRTPDERSYELASRFAARCGKDRGEHLRRLLKARDPLVQTASACYLRFESEAVATAALTRLSKTKALAAAWAALTLARDGDRAATARAIALLPPTDEFNAVYSQLRKRLTALIDNTAHAAGIPAPGRKNLAAWWRKHGDKVTPKDPWLKLCRDGKID